MRAIHQDYLRVGADIITANSYNSNRGQLATIGAADRMEELSDLAVRVAREARDSMKPEAYVAGSIAPTNRFPRGWDPDRVQSQSELAHDWGDQAAVLEQAGADLILIETMSAIFQLIPAMDAAQATGLPVFLGIHATDEGTMTSGETMKALVESLDGRLPEAILLMCRPPEAISATMPALREAFIGPIGAYADIGYGRSTSGPEGSYHTIEIGSNTPRRYAQYCEQWLDMGAQIIGGCCATTPNISRPCDRSSGARRSDAENE